MKHTFAIAAAPRKNSKSWPQLDPKSWDGLLEWLDLDNPADHKECGGYVLGELKGRRRTKDSVISRSALTLDADYARSTLLDDLKERRWTSAAYSTWSHRIEAPDAPRYRLVIVLSRDVTPGEYRVIAAWVMHEFGTEQFDPSSDQPERLMFKPSTQNPADYESAVFEGEPLDVDAVLADAPPAVEEDPAPATAPAVPQPVTDRDRAYALVTYPWNLDKLRETMQLDEGGSTDDRWEQGWERSGVFHKACLGWELVNSSGGEITAEEFETAFMAEVREAGFEEQGKRKLSDARERVGTRLAEIPEDFETPLERARADFGPLGPDDDQHEQEVLRELARLEVRDEARRRFELRRAPAPEPWDAGTLSEHLLKPPPPPARIDGLVPWEASTAIIAQRKAGKTTLELNLAWSLITGEPFLGGREVLPVEGRVALLNFEVSGAQIAAWAQKAGVPPDRLFIVNLRGASNPFRRPEELARLATLLREQEVEALIVDPFGRAFTGDDQNNAGQVQGWLLTLDEFARRDVGALDIFLSVHAGWNGERTRGSSAMEDWADSLINLTRKEDETRGTDDRFIKADGRDVDLPEDQLLFDPSNLRLSLSGYGSRKAASAARKIDDLVPGVVEIVKREPGIKAGGIAERLKENGFNFQRGDDSKARQEAVAQGLLEVRSGPKNATNYYPQGGAPEESSA